MFVKDCLNTEWEWMGRGWWRGWRWPVVPVSGHLLRHGGWSKGSPVPLNPYHIEVHRDFDSDSHLFAWIPIAPFAVLFFWWTRGTRWRYVIERWMQYHIADVPEGESLLSWTIRPLNRWSWHRTRSDGRRVSWPK